MWCVEQRVIIVKNCPNVARQREVKGSVIYLSQQKIKEKREKKK